MPGSAASLKAVEAFVAQRLKHFADKRNDPNFAIVFAVFDKDKGSKDDPMGEVHIPLKRLLGQVAQGCLK